MQATLRHGGDAQVVRGAQHKVCHRGDNSRGEVAASEACEYNNNNECLTTVLCSDYGWESLRAWVVQRHADAKA